MEGGMVTTSICNPHICRALLGTVEFCGGTLGYYRVLWVLWGTVVYCGDTKRYCVVLWGTVCYCWLLLVTTGYWGVLGGTGVHPSVNSIKQYTAVSYRTPHICICQIFASVKWHSC